MTASHSPFQTMFTGVPEEHLTIAAAEVESYARAVLDDIRTSSFMGTASEGSFTATASIAQLRAAAVAILHSPNPDPWAERSCTRSARPVTPPPNSSPTAYSACSTASPTPPPASPAHEHFSMLSATGLRRRAPSSCPTNHPSIVTVTKRRRGSALCTFDWWPRTSSPSASLPSEPICPSTPLTDTAEKACCPSPTLRSDGSTVGALQPSTSG